MKFKSSFVILLFVLGLAGCTRSFSGTSPSLPPPENTSPAIQPTETPVHVTETSEPTPSYTPPATATFEPTSVPITATPLPGTPPATPTISLPADAPLKLWNGLPIIPGAITGEELDDRYRFMLTAKVEDVRKFYKTELPKLGWEFVADGTGENSAPVTMFKKGDSFLSISLEVFGEIIIVSLVPI